MSIAFRVSLALTTNVVVLMTICAASIVRLTKLNTPGLAVLNMPGMSVLSLLLPVVPWNLNPSVIKALLLPWSMKIKVPACPALLDAAPLAPPSTDDSMNWPSFQVVSL